MFVVNGAVLGTWVAAIPGTKDGLEATGGEWGLALLFLPVGALVAQQITGQLLVRVSSRRLLTVAALIFPWLVLPPIAAPDLVVLAATLFAFRAAGRRLGFVTRSTCTLPLRPFQRNDSAYSSLIRFDGDP
jgi:hypothetical protein